MPPSNNTRAEKACNPITIPPEIETEIENEAQAAAEEVRRRRRVDFLLASRPPAPTSSDENPSRKTRSEFAKLERVSEATVSRWVAEGMPTIPIGSSYHIEPTAANAWRLARGRKPTKASASKRDIEVDVDAELSRAGLRVVGGGR